MQICSIILSESLPHKCFRRLVFLLVAAIRYCAYLSPFLGGVFFLLAGGDAAKPASSSSSSSSSSSQTNRFTPPMSFVCRSLDGGRLTSRRKYHHTSGAQSSLHPVSSSHLPVCVSAHLSPTVRGSKNRSSSTHQNTENEKTPENLDTIRKKIKALKNDIKLLAEQVETHNNHLLSSDDEDDDYYEGSTTASDEDYDVSDFEDETPEEVWPWNSDVITSGIRNQQSDIPLDKGLLEIQAQHIKDIMNINKGIIRIDLISEDLMKKLNLEARGLDQPTDVLSFPYTDIQEAQDTFPMLRSLESGTTMGEIPLGYIFMCPSYIQKQMNIDRQQHEKGSPNLGEKKDSGVAQLLKESFCIHERLGLLMIHSYLHLLQYDHESEGDSAKMAAEELRVAKILKSRLCTQNKPTGFGHRVIGVGTDMSFIPRIRRIIDTSEKRFVERLFSPREMSHFTRIRAHFHKTSQNRQILWKDWAASYLAKRFATKEAVAKALGTGLQHVTSGGISLKDIEVISLESGQPTICLKDYGRKRAEQLGVSHVYVSQTDESNFALAFATACGGTSDLFSPSSNEQ